MTLHNQPLYERIEDIPDLGPEHLFLPLGSKLLVVKEPEHTSETTTPVEVSYYFFKIDPYSFPAERQILNLFITGDLKVPDDFLRSNWGNHLGRIVLKTLLDPNRHAPLDLVRIYRAESKFRGHNYNEEAFFSRFIENWGVLKRH